MVFERRKSILPSSEFIQLHQVCSQVKGTIDEVSRTDAAKKATEFSSVVGKRAEEAAKVVGGAAESIGKSDAFKAATQSAATIKQERSCTKMSLMIV